MEKTARQTALELTKTYLLLMKPGIIMGNMLTMAGGFFLASKGTPNIWVFLVVLLGLAMIIASAAICNNYIDREIDKKMERTKDRAFAQESVSIKKALLFATLLGITGSILLLQYSNPITTAIAILGFMIYVFVYSFSKYRTMHGTIIGSIAGAVPPVVGYCSVSGSFDIAAGILFFMLVFWQIPHFFSIVLFRLEEYAAASLPVMPLVKDIKRTKQHMTFYILLFTLSSTLLSIYHYTNDLFLLGASILGGMWFFFSLRGFFVKNEKVWAREMFFFSLLVILSLSLLIPFTVM